MSGGIRSIRDGPVGRLVVDNPSRRNAMSLDMYAAVPAAVDALLDEPGLRVVVLRGAGSDAFGAGSDIGEFRERRLGNDHEHFDAVETAALHAIAALPVPVVAAIHGPCMGGGLGVALAADLRWAADDAQFAVPPGRLGIGYPMDAIDRLRTIVGVAEAKRLVLTAARIDAEEARRIGLIHHVVAKADLDRSIEELAASISRLAPLTLIAAKAGLDQRPEAAELTAACYHSDDYVEGIAAFEESRRPRFRGR